MRPSRELVESLHLFHALRAPEIDRITAASYIEKRPRGTVIQEHDDLAAYIYFLLEGTVECTGSVLDEHRGFMFLHGGKFFPLASIVLNQPTPLSYVAATECVVLRMPAALIRELIAAAPAFALTVLNECAVCCRDLIGELRVVHVRNGVDRLAYWLVSEARRRKALADFEVSLPKGRIADVLNFAPEMLSRYLTMLKDVGVTSTHNTIRIGNVDRLEAFVRTDAKVRGTRPADHGLRPA